MARAIAHDLDRRTTAFKALASGPSLPDRIFTGRLSSSEVAKLEAQPYYLFAYQGDSLVFWNTNEVMPLPGMTADSSNGRIADLKGCRVILHTLDAGNGRKLLALLPLARSYLVENKYLSSGFAASSLIPAASQLLPEATIGAVPVKEVSGKLLFYLQVPAEEMAVLPPDALTIVLCLAALLCSLIWVQLLILFFTRKRSHGLGILFTILLVAGARALLYRTGLPFHLDDTRLFSSELYGYNGFLPSLGDLLLNVLCFLWIVVFILTQAPYRNYFRNWRLRWYNYILAYGLLQLLVLFVFALVPVLRSVVVDSQISFDVSRIHAIDRYTIIGLFTIGMMVSVSGLLIHFVNILSGNLVRRRWVKYGLLLVALTPLVLIAPMPFLWIHLSVALWVLAFVLILDLPHMTLTADLFSPYMVFWSVFVCACMTALTLFFIRSREREKDRIAFASHVAGRQDLLMEYNFQTMADNLEKDPLIRDFIRQPAADKRSRLNEYLNAYYFSKQLSQYQSTLYIFDGQGHGLYNRDTLSMASFDTRLSSGTPSVDLRLFFNETASDDHYYLAQLTIYDSLGSRTATLFLDLELRRAVNETLYPELLQPANVNKAQGLASYDYAVYADGRLKYLKGDYPFPVSIPPDAIQGAEYEYRKGNGGDELWYRNQGRLVIVAGTGQLWLEAVTLFSYIFGLQMLVSFIVMMYRMALEYFLRPRGRAFAFNLTLRRRIHFAMLAMVLVAFLVIGSVTTFFFSRRYQSSSYTSLQGKVKNLERQMTQYFSNRDVLSARSFDTLCRTPQFRSFLSSVSEDQSTDLSIFNRGGHLLAASQEDVYAKDLLSPLMLPYAYNQMKQGRSILLQRENIGGLFYLSCYVSLQNREGEVLGYLNVPFYSSEKELEDQISGILVALVNLYAFLFLLSSLLALLITNGLTRTLNVIIRQFERLNLQRNELLEWPYDDEIGLLVREYNKMVRKVEENAAMLAQNEREGAWREMARQVAHEIKNPLTPMKLNIQYLQQALKNNHPRLQELTERVSGTLIEQIDHLSHIASEFSNFAKMPDARPEVLNLSKVLSSVADLFHNESGVQLQVDLPSEPVHVYTDRGQMIRVYTNLLQNAIQALEEKEDGRVGIKLLVEGGHAVTQVTDNGKGIPEDLRERLFQPYFTTKSSGTGLGLAMTRKIIELWKGSIWFESVEGEGTTFFIRLPLSVESSAEDEAE